MPVSHESGPDEHTKAYANGRDGPEAGGPFAPASSIASTSPRVRSATKPQNGGVEYHNLTMEGDKGWGRTQVDNAQILV
jgi:hypothetical protein